MVDRLVGGLVNILQCSYRSTCSCQYKIYPLVDAIQPEVNPMFVLPFLPFAFRKNQSFNKIVSVHSSLFDAVQFLPLLKGSAQEFLKNLVFIFNRVMYVPPKCSVYFIVIIKHTNCRKTLELSLPNSLHGVTNNFLGWQQSINTSLPTKDLHYKECCWGPAFMPVTKLVYVC